jgi:DNA-binding GntR family transcriptional regulator
MPDMMSLEELRAAIDTVLEFIATVTEEDDSKVDELAFRYLQSVATGQDHVESSELARRFVCRFSEWVGAKTALEAMRQDDWMHTRAIDIATKYLQLPPRPPPPKRKASD